MLQGPWNGVSSCVGVVWPTIDAHLDAPRDRAEERVLDLEDEREAVHDPDVRVRGVDEREVGLERRRVAKAVVDDDPRRRAARRFVRRDVERRAPGGRPRVEERALERLDGRSLDARPGVEPRHLAPERGGPERHLVEARVVLVREVPSADEREAAVHDGDLPVVALLQILDRRRAGDGAHETQLHVRAGAKALQERVRQAEGAVETVQRVDDDAHRDAPRRRRGERGLHLGADVVVHRHVDLEVDAPLGARESVEEPAARRRVVELDLDAVARDRKGPGRGIEP